MAPEIFLQQGYSFAVDLWSIGIIIYETLTGSVPFGEDTDDILEIYHQINKANLQFPESIKDEKFNDLKYLVQ